MTKSIEQIRKDVSELEGSVLSIYLNTNPSSEDWKIRLKNGLKKTEQYTAASRPEIVDKFAKISKTVDKMIRNNQASFTNSLVCFASADKVHMYHFQFTVENDFQWEQEPATEQLEELFKIYPKKGVLLLQRDKITLLTSSLGELVNETHYEFDIEKENWTQYKGLAYGAVYASSANHRDKFDRRIKENQARWYKQIVPTIEKHARNRNWDGVHIAGPADLAKDMKQQLNIKVTGETTQNYSGKSAHAILNRTILA